MALDIKKCGKCLTCKNCEDIGTQECDGITSYVRKCKKPGKEYIDNCVTYCDDYEWDGSALDEQPDTVQTTAPSFTAPIPTYGSEIYQQGYQYQPFPAKKSKTGLVLGLVFGGLGILIIASVILFVVFSKGVIFKKEESKTTNKNNQTTLSVVTGDTSSQSNTSSDSNLTSSTSSTPVEEVGKIYFDERMYIVTTDNTTLRMRSEPYISEDMGEKSNAFAEIPRFGVVTVGEESNGWLLVNYNNQTGWCHSDYLTNLNSFDQTIVSSAGAVMQSTTKSTAKKLGNVPGYATVPVIRVTKDGKWTRIYYSGQTGWVPSTSLN